MTSTYIGSPLRRSGDERLLRGRGCYVADLRLPNALEAAFVRSPHARARIRRVDAGPALRLPGVVGVLTGDDLGGIGPIPMWCLPGEALRRQMEHLSFTRFDAPVLARGQALHVGAPVAVVIAEDRYQAEDAIEAVRVDYEPLPPQVDPLCATVAGAPRVHADLDSNLIVHVVARKGEPESALSGTANAIVAGRYRSGRIACVSIEARGAIAQYDERRRELTLWSSTQFPFEARELICRSLGVPESRVRVIAPDVGGGFGGKAVVYPEEVLVSLLAMRLGRPVRWLSDRREDMISTIQSRDQEHEIELSVNPEGAIEGLRDRFVLDTGAYNPVGIGTPYNTIAHLQGPYRIPHLRAEALVVTTNKVANAPYRGAGRPEAVFAMERILDRAARAVGLDPVEFRSRNLVPATQMPYDAGLCYRDGLPLLYDSGDYPAMLWGAVEAVGGLEAFRRRQAEARKTGESIGLGVAMYVEGTGVGPYEGATVSVDTHGTVTVATGSSAHGQGHETSFAQVCADALDVPIDSIRVLGGGTALTPYGVGTFASRSMVCGGNAVLLAARQVRDKAVLAAARLFETRPEDVELHDGKLAPRGVRGRQLALGELVAALAPDGPLGQEMGPGLSASACFRPPTVTYASAAHAAVVRVDAETGFVAVLRYAIAHDCGRVVNPVIVDGQVSGGLAQGLGAALLEEVLYDPRTGQLLTGSLMDYLVPTAESVPRCATLHQDSVSPRNELGVKGVGKGGAIAPPAAVANAIEDALAWLGAEITACPATPARVLQAIEKARRL